MAHFSQIVVCDFEYEIQPGGLPNFLCMVAYVLDAEPPARAHHPHVARRVQQVPAVRRRPRHFIRGL